MKAAAGLALMKLLLGQSITFAAEPQLYLRGDGDLVRIQDINPGLASYSLPVLPSLLIGYLSLGTGHSK